MKKRILALALSAFLVFSLTPQPRAVYGEETGSGKIIYVDKSVSGGAGTKTSPFEDISDALAKADNGDTIIFTGRGGFANDPVGQNDPLIINKRVTIEGERQADGSRLSFNVRRANIVLGADVVFKNFDFNYTNSACSIFANGHSLSLSNVGYVTNTKLVNIYGGTIEGVNAPSGDKSIITLSGKNTYVGSVHAGSYDSDWDKPTDITVSGSVANISGIRADGGYGSSPNDCSSQVTITLTDSNVKSVDGVQDFFETKMADLIVSVSGTNSSMQFSNIGRLDLLQGRLAPKSMSMVRNIDIGASGVLDLSQVTGQEINSLKAEKGSILYLNQTDTLKIGSSFTGESEFRTVNKAAVMQTESGVVDEDHAYVDLSSAGDKSGIFTFHPYFTQEDISLKLVDGKWTAVKGSSSQTDQGSTTPSGGGSGSTAPSGGDSGSTAPTEGGSGSTAPSGGDSGSTAPSGGGSESTAPSGGSSGSTAPSGGGSGSTAPSGGDSGSTSPSGGSSGSMAPSGGGNSGITSPSEGGSSGSTIPSGGDSGSTAPSGGGSESTAPSGGGSESTAPSGQDTPSGGDSTAEPAETEAVVTVKARVSGTTAAASLEDSVLEQAIESGRQSGDMTVTAYISTGKAKKLVFSIPKAAVSRLAASGVTSFTVKSGVASAALDLNAIKAVRSKTKKDVTIKLSRTTAKSLSSGVKKKVVNRPVYDFSLTDKSGKKITRLSGGTFTVSVPYTLSSKEKSKNLVIYYINSKGGSSGSSKASYDAASKTVSFRMKRITKFAVANKKA